MKKFLCIGHAAYDITLPLQSYPLENKKIIVKDTVECSGGVAANIASTLAKWNNDSWFVGIVGEDREGYKIAEEMKKMGVNITYLQFSKTFSTTKSYIMINKENGSRTILINKTKTTNEICTTIQITPDVIIVDGEEVEFSKKTLLDNKHAISILDAGHNRPEIIELGHLVTYLICSKEFAEEYTGLKIEDNKTSSIIPIYDKLYSVFKTNIIITLEEGGSFTRDNNQYRLIPSINVKPIDTTGAGDIYHAAFAYFISNQYSVVDSMKYANIAGALSTKTYGSSQSIPPLGEVLQIGEQYDKTKFNTNT